MAIPTPAQVRGARSMLGLTQAELSKLAGVSLPRVIAMEQGHDHLQSTHDAFTEALEAKGAVFDRSGTVKIEPKSDLFIVPAGQHPSPEDLRLSLHIVNASRAASGLPPLRLEEDE